MKMKLIDRTNEYWIESLIVLVAFGFTWLGHGEFTGGVLVLAFLVSLFFRKKSALIFRDRMFVFILVLFVINAVISSLLSIDKTKSALLSLVAFLWVYVPYSYIRFSINEKNDYFIRWVMPVGLCIALIIVLYLISIFMHTLLTEGLVFKRYTFIWLAKATTPDTLVILSGLGYGWLRQKEGNKYRWLGFLFLMFCFFGVLVTYDRGGLMSIFVVAIILLSYDYKRLILFLGLIGAGFALSFVIEELAPLHNFIEYFYSEKAQEVLKTRTQIATFYGAWEMIKDNWLMGVGTNNYSEFSKLYGTKIRWSYAHNFILQFWAENGLFGMSFGLSLIGLVLYRWLKSFKKYKYRYIAVGVGASFIGLLVGNLTNSTIWILGTAISFWGLAGVMSAIYFIVKEEDQTLKPS